MKKLIAITLMTATFLGGYYLGRLPGSPDIFAWMQGTYQQIRSGGKSALAEVPGRPLRGGWRRADLQGRARADDQVRLPSSLSELVRALLETDSDE